MWFDGPLRKSFNFIRNTRKVLKPVNVYVFMRSISEYPTVLGPALSGNVDIISNDQWFTTIREKHIVYILELKDIGAVQNALKPSTLKKLAEYSLFVIFLIHCFCCLE